MPIYEAQGTPPSHRARPPRQLPADTAYFTNHAHYLDELNRLTGVGSAGRAPRRSPVVVITGLGGIGKTTLATHWAHDVSGLFEDGQLFFDLRGYSGERPTDPGTVLDGFLRNLGVCPERIPVDLEGRAGMFRSEVAERRVLIMLDNAADTAQVGPLIPGGTGTVVIVTSRNQLSGLGARNDARRIRLDAFQERHAVELLKEVTMAGGRQDDEAELAELARLCARLPLALRIIAEHATARPEMLLSDLLAELRDDATLLDTLSTDDGEAVRAIFDWSYRQLPPDAARMFRALGLHHGAEISLGAAAAAAGVPGKAAGRALDILRQRHIVDPVRWHRYRQHNLLRAYAKERAHAIDSEDERRAAIGRIVRWYTATAQNVSETLLEGRAFELDTAALGTGTEPDTFGTPEEAREWFDAERPNLVANARSALDADLPRHTWELAMVLSPIHASYFTFDDWSVLSELALTAAGRIDDPAALASALDNRGRFLLRRGILDEAKTAHARALAIQEETGDQRGACRSLNALGLVSFQAGDLAAAIDYLEDAIHRSRRAGQSRWHDAASVNLAHAKLESGLPEEAMALLEPLPRSFAGRNDHVNVGTSYRLIAWVHRLRGDHAVARDAIDEALRIAVDHGTPVWEADWLIESAQVHLAMGDEAQAMADCQRAVSLQREVGDGWREALALSHLAEIEAESGRDEDSRNHAARALELIERFTGGRAITLKESLRRRLS